MRTDAVAPTIPLHLCRGGAVQAEGGAKSGFAVRQDSTEACYSGAMRLLPPLAAALVFLSAAPAARASFTDVPEGHRYAEAFRELQLSGILRGDPAGTARPDAPLTRAEFTVIVVRALADESEQQATCRPIYHSGSVGFASDVEKDGWYDEAVCYAKVKGLIEGYPDGTFRPARAINAAEAMKILAAAFLHQESTDSSPWYRDPVEALALVRAVPRSIASFDSSLTRGEMAEMLRRLTAHDDTRSSQTYADIAAHATADWRFDAGRGVGFEVPAGWPVSFSGKEWEWIARAGEKCAGCLEGDDGWPWILTTQGGRNAEDAVAEWKADDGTDVYHDEKKDLAHPRLVFAAQGGMCGDLVGYAFPVRSPAIALKGRCMDDAKDGRKRLEELARSVTYRAPLDWTVSAFDACGKPSTYAGKAWAPDIRLAMEAHGMTWDDDAVGDVCMALDERMVIFTRPGGYCEGGRVFRYDVGRAVLEQASVDWKTRGGGCLAPIAEFGKRSGGVIPVTGAFGDAGYLAELHYLYDVSRNHVTLSAVRSVDASGQDGKETETWTRY